MTSLPMPLPSSLEIPRGENEQFLVQAFRSFVEVAKSLEENRQMRQHLDRILDGLPCGVLVTKANGAISLINPEGRPLLSLVTSGAIHDLGSCG